ncbi:Protein CBG27337 [Caenorhabditis briggsae]|uniref:Protein CBG27337 n=1 Tax=Caenorhabditis briggsae TaxID=6238 RepID=B6IE96_CAEBR|nr:Protein CBG27337 [Caenorhabditis briggsae]CAS01160.1 Protein CBG27337 [Caenorhabditis briggsae]
MKNEPVKTLSLLATSAPPPTFSKDLRVSETQNLRISVFQNFKISEYSIIVHLSIPHNPLYKVHNSVPGTNYFQLTSLEEGDPIYFFASHGRGGIENIKVHDDHWSRVNSN